MRIVLVESDVGARGGLPRLLEARGHELFSFEEGREALARIAAD
jgi:DNA-binding response OmpR family regulator